MVGLDGGNVRGGRGEDVPWKLVESFENMTEFKAGAGAGGCATGVVR